MKNVNKLLNDIRMILKGEIYMKEMSISELYEKNKREKEMAMIESEEARRARLANTVLKAFQNKEMIEDITQLLIKNGSVTVKGFGCLCQGGMCSWQKGFTDYLETLYKEWEIKGVSIRYGIPGVTLSVNNVYPGYSTINIADYK